MDDKIRQPIDTVKHFSYPTYGQPDLVLSLKHVSRLRKEKATFSKLNSILCCPKMTKNRSYFAFPLTVQK